MNGLAEHRLRPACVQDSVMNPVMWDTNIGVEEIKARKAECNQIQKGFECQDEDLDLALCAVGLGRGRISDTTGG